MSSSAGSLRSAKLGAVTGQHFNEPFWWFINSVCIAASSISSATNKIGLRVFETSSSNGTKSAMSVIVLSYRNT